MKITGHIDEKWEGEMLKDKNIGKYWIYIIKKQKYFFDNFHLDYGVPDYVDIEYGIKNNQRWIIKIKYSEKKRKPSNRLWRVYK